MTFRNPLHVAFKRKRLANHWSVARRSTSFTNAEDASVPPDLSGPPLTPPPSSPRTKKVLRLSFKAAIGALGTFKTSSLKRLKKLRRKTSFTVHDAVQTDADGNSSMYSVIEPDTSTYELASFANSHTSTLPEVELDISFALPSTPPEDIGQMPDGLTERSWSPDPISCAINPDERHPEVMTLALRAAHGNKTAQDTVISIVKQIHYTDEFHLLDNYTTQAQDFDRREIRLLQRAIAMIDVRRFAEEGYIDQDGLYIFQNQLFPTDGSFPLLSAETFDVFLAELECSGVLTSWEKSHLYVLQPYFDDEPSDLENDTWSLIEDSLVYGQEEQVEKETQSLNEDSFVFEKEDEGEGEEKGDGGEEEEEEGEEESAACFHNPDPGVHIPLETLDLTVDPEPELPEGAIMTAEEFNKLPHWDEVEHIAEYNTPLPRRPLSWYRLPEYDEDSQSRVRATAPSVICKLKQCLFWFCSWRVRTVSSARREK
jgi:hypothetical protein